MFFFGFRNNLAKFASIMIFVHYSAAHSRVWEMSLHHSIDTNQKTQCAQSVLSQCKKDSDFLTKVSECMYYSYK